MGNIGGGAVSRKHTQETGVWVGRRYRVAYYKVTFVYGILAAFDG